MERFIYFFCFIYLILPEYFAIEISPSLPLLTAARLMIIVFFFVVLIVSIRRKSIRIIADKRIWLCFGVYFVLRLIANLKYITVYSDSVNVVIKMIAEQLSLLILLPALLDDEDKRIQSIKMIVFGSGVVSVLGIAESITGIRLANLLYTANRDMLNFYYIRMGVLRANAGFGISNFLAFYLVVVTPFVFWLRQKEEKIIYLVIGVMNFFALVFTGCRGNLFAYAAVVIIYMFMQNKEQAKIFGKNLLIGALIVTVISTVHGSLDDVFGYYYTGTVKSMLNVVGFDFDLNEGAPDGVNGYGPNAERGTVSRTEQFSGIPYVLSMDPLFGLGAGAQNRGEICYYRNGEYKRSHTYDVGYVAIVGDEGLVGTLGLLTLLAGIVIIYISSLRNAVNEEKKSYFKVFLLANIAFLMCMFFAVHMMNVYWLINAVGLSCLKDKHYEISSRLIKKKTDAE